jgi:uncharacterized membrane protein YqhA
MGPFIQFLSACRFLLLIPVLGCVILTLGVVVMAFGRILTAVVAHIQAGDVSAQASKKMSVAVIEIIDLFLIATVSYITAIGLYKLFINRIDFELPMRLKIDNLKDLEDKIIGVIVAALAIAFLGRAAGTDEPGALLDYGAGIALVIGALAIFTTMGKKAEPPGGA